MTDFKLTRKETTEIIRKETSGKIHTEKQEENPKIEIKTTKTK